MTATTEPSPHRKRTPWMAYLFGRSGTISRGDRTAPGMDIHFIEWCGETYIQAITIYRERSTPPQPPTATTDQPAFP